MCAVVVIVFVLVLLSVRVCVFVFVQVWIVKHVGVCVAVCVCVGVCVGGKTMCKRISNVGETVTLFVRDRWQTGSSGAALGRSLLVWTLAFFSCADIFHVTYL